MRTAKQFADGLISLGITDPTSVEALVKDYIQEILEECRTIARTVASKNRTQYGYSVGQPIPGQPHDGVILSLHDTWVAAAQTIGKKIDELKGAQ